MAEILPLPTAWALMGYTVGVAVYGANLLFGIPKGDATSIGKGMAAWAFAYGGIAELIAALWFLIPIGTVEAVIPGATRIEFTYAPGSFLAATTFGVYGTYWLGLAILVWVGGDLRVASFMAFPVWIFSFIAAAAWYMAGATIVSILVILIGLIFLVLTPGLYTGRPMLIKAGGAICLISIIVSLYLVAAVIFNVALGYTLPL